MTVYVKSTLTHKTYGYNVMYGYQELDITRDVYYIGRLSSSMSGINNELEREWYNSATSREFGVILHFFIVIIYSSEVMIYLSKNGSQISQKNREMKMIILSENTNNNNCLQ